MILTKKKFIITRNLWRLSIRLGRKKKKKKVNLLGLDYLLSLFLV